MSLQSNTMSNPVPPSQEPVSIILVRKLVLLILLMVVAALGLLFLLRNARVYSPLLSHILSDAAIGLIAGFSSRWILRKQTTFLRITATLAFLVCALELLGWFTGWQIGLSPLQIGRSNVDWLSLGQLLLGTGVSILALYAWTFPVLVIEPAPHREVVQSLPRGLRQPAKRPRRSVTTPAIGSRRAGRTVRTAPVASPELSVKPRRRRITQRKPQLQLSTEEERRCPYCLEPIIQDDPRGTVECKICHTLHHGDCWAITGACQVPHYTA
jgi:hypothetical protein